jgi:hypothetical protein
MFFIIRTVTDNVLGCGVCCRLVGWICSLTSVANSAAIPFFYVR